MPAKLVLPSSFKGENLGVNRITRHCKVKFAITIDFIGEVECVVALLEA